MERLLAEMGLGCLSELVHLGLGWRKTPREKRTKEYP
jgi:hypothetical protein